LTALFNREFACHGNSREAEYTVTKHLCDVRIVPKLLRPGLSFARTVK